MKLSSDMQQAPEASGLNAELYLLLGKKERMLDRERKYPFINILLYAREKVTGVVHGSMWPSITEVHPSLAVHLNSFNTSLREE